ncbi:amidohydrolase [bacterium]|nr:amidohydrolase [bacterium]
MIIDTHAQLYTRKFIEQVKAGKITGLEKMGYASFFKGIVFDTIEDMDRARVDKSIVVAVDAETTRGFRVSNELVAEAVRLYPDRLIGFAGVDPHKGKIAVDELDYAVNELGLVGLKIIPHLIDLCPNDPLMYPVLDKVAELDIPVLFHTGTHFHTGCKLGFNRPEYIDDLAVDFPTVTFIMAHFGYPWFYEAMAVVQKNDNVYFNIAGWSPRYIPEPVVKHMNSLLSKKVLFGSDHPLLSRKKIIDEIRELSLKESTLDDLFEHNAFRMLSRGQKNFRE